jgi:hypothetical protein
MGRKAGPPLTGVPLKDRPLIGGGAPAAPAARKPAPPLRHVWVRDPNGTDLEMPGLLLEWRKDPDTGAWSAQCCYLVDDGRVFVVQWLPADKVRPAV